MEILRKAIASIGFRGTYLLGLLDHKHVLMRFDNIEDFMRCWLKNLWMIQDFPMRVFKWSPDFRIDAESTHVPVWVSLEALLIHSFDKVALFMITSTIGSPLKLDAATALLSRPNVARICVEVNLCKDLPQCIWIVVGEGGFWKKVVYENFPAYCNYRHRQGHDLTYRRLLNLKEIPKEEPSTTHQVMQYKKSFDMHRNKSLLPRIRMLLEILIKNQ